MAPQLRGAPRSREAGRDARPGRAPGGDEQGFADRPAETNRDLLSSLQSGWTAARGEDEDVETDGSAVFDERIERGNP
jgi:hypothetical protein